MSVKRLAAVAFVAVSMTSAAAVASITAGAQAAQTVKLGFITKFPVTYYFQMVQGAHTWLKSNTNVSVTFDSGKSATDDAGEIAAIQDLVAAGVKGIVITPTSPAVIPELNKAVKAGVKIVLADNDLPTWNQKTSVVATDNYAGGVLAGQFLSKRLKAGDTLGILVGVPGVPALVDRVSGMLKGLGSLKSKIKVVSQLETDCDQTKGEQQAQTMLTANPHLTAIYSACGPPALGAIQAIQHAGIKTGGIILVGFDGLPQEVTAVKAGTETATIQQHPVLEGSDSLAVLYKAVQGKSVPKDVNTGVSIITPQNA